jgi:hypothetical protein
MKTRILYIAAAIVVSGLLSNLSAQETKESKIETELHKLQISDIKNNVVTIEDLDEFVKDHQKIEVRISSEYGKYSEYGKSLYTKHRWTKENRKVAYDFSQFPDGIYIVELFNKNQLVCSRVVEKQTAVQTENRVASLVTKAK